MIHLPHHPPLPDDIIKANKKGGASSGKAKPTAGGARRGRGGGRGGVRRSGAGVVATKKANNAGTARAGRRGARQNLTSQRKFTTAKKTFATPIAKRNRVRAMAAALKLRGAKAAVANKSSNRNLIQRLVKKAVLQKARVASARRTINRPNMQNAAKRIRALRALVVGNGGNRAAQRRALIGQSRIRRQAVLSGQMRARLGWTNKNGGVVATRGGRRANNNARGRGLAGARTHMDVELQSRAQRARVQQQITRINRQQRQQIQFVDARQRLGGNRGGRGGRGAATTAQFIRNTVFQAIAEASMAGAMQRQPQQQRMARQPMYRAQNRMGMNAFGGQFDRFDRPTLRSGASFERVGGMRAFDGDEFSSTTRVRSQFAGASSGRTLNDRFAGGDRVRVNNGSRQFFF